MRNLAFFTAVSALLVLPARAQLFVTDVERKELPFSESDLVGTYSTRRCDSLALSEDEQVSNIRRVYNWDLTNYTVSYAFFADEECQQPLFTFFFAGPYALGRPRPELGKVREAQIIFATVTMRADSEAGSAILRESCGPHAWRPGLVRDVSEHACLIKQPRAQCIGDNELIMLDGDRLAPGVRTSRMCEPEGRPRKIQPIAAIRVRP